MSGSVAFSATIELLKPLEAEARAPTSIEKRVLVRGSKR